VTKYWGRFREDMMTHVRTEWFGAVEHSIMLQCRCANPAGVMAKSVRMIAQRASGDRLTHVVTEEDVSRSLHRLVEAGHCVWYRELETIWWVNMADEQRPAGCDDDDPFWTLLGNQLVPKLAAQVRLGLFRRYPHLNPAKPSDVEVLPVLDAVELRQFGLFPTDTDADADPNADAETNSTRRFSRLGSHSGFRSNADTQKRKRKAATVHASHIEAVIREINDARAQLVPNSRGYRLDSKNQREWVRRATKRESATLEDWKCRIRNMLEACKRHEFWVQHFSLEHIHRPKNWEKWGDDSSLPPMPTRKGGGGGGPPIADFGGEPSSYGAPVTTELDDDAGVPL
jgi:hypothetical protein